MIEYIQKIYDITKFTYFSVTSMKRDGVFDRNTANKLLKQKKIRRREGMHGDIIQIIESKLIDGKLKLDSE